MKVLKKVKRCGDCVFFGEPLLSGYNRCTHSLNGIPQARPKYVSCSRFTKIKGPKDKPEPPPLREFKVDIFGVEYLCKDQREKS